MFPCKVDGNRWTRDSSIPTGHGRTIYFCGGGAREMKTSRVENFKPGRVCFLPSVPTKNYYVCDVRGMQEGGKKGREKIKKMARGSTIRTSSFPSHRGGYSRSKLSSLWAGSWRNLSELDQWTIMLRDGLFVDGISLQGYCESK